MNKVQFDIERQKQRFTDFWNCQNETPLISLKCFRDKPGYDKWQQTLKRDKRFADVFYRKADPEIKIDYQLKSLSFMHFSGDTMPVLSSEIGPGMSAAFLGAIVDLGSLDQPTWFFDNMEDYDSMTQFHPKNSWYIIQREIVRYACEVALKESILSEIPVDLYNGIDTLMLIRGSENLAMDLIMRPDEVKEASKRIVYYWKRWIDDFFELTKPETNGNSTAWLNLWGPGRTITLQSDFMTMISAEMYEEFILPDVTEMSRHADWVNFHFDGPDEVIRHLNFLLDLDSIHSIQWNPKTNCENLRHLPVLKEIQSKNKCLILNAGMDEVEILVEELSPKGLLINIEPFSTPMEDPKVVDQILEKLMLKSNRRT